MHYQTVKDVVDHSRQLHQDISGLYEKLSEGQARVKVGMLLEHLQRHEDNLEQLLSQFTADKSQKVLENWLQFSPDQDVADVLAGLTISEHMDTDQVVNMALKLDDYFIELYQEIIDHSSSTSVKSVFQNLLDMEQHEKISMAKAAMQLKDL